MQFIFTEAMALLKTKPLADREAEVRRETHVERIILDDTSFDAFSAELAKPSPPTANLVALFRK